MAKEAAAPVSAWRRRRTRRSSRRPSKPRPRPFGIGVGVVVVALTVLTVWDWEYGTGFSLRDGVREARQREPGDLGDPRHRSRPAVLATDAGGVHRDAAPRRAGHIRRRARRPAAVAVVDPVRRAEPRPFARSCAACPTSSAPSPTSCGRCCSSPPSASARCPGCWRCSSSRSPSSPSSPPTRSTASTSVRSRPPTPAEPATARCCARPSSRRSSRPTPRTRCTPSSSTCGRRACIGLVGAGGIGQRIEFFVSQNNWEAVWGIVVMFVIVVFVVDRISTLLRRRLV